jgi:Flp pilus assembly protein TadD
LGNRWQAVRDYSRAIELNPNDAEAYCGRGLAYDTLGNSRQALEDLKIAAGLGSKNAQDFLRSKGISW